MHISDDLKKEHQLILKYIDLMERYIEFSLENSNKPILLDKAEEFIGFIQNLPMNSIMQKKKIYFSNTWQLRVS